MTLRFSQYIFWFPKMQKFSDDFRAIENSCDGFEFEMYDENMNNSNIHNSVLNHESNTSDSSISFPKQQ